MNDSYGPDILKEFLVESYENLDQLDRDLVALEQEPNSQTTLSSVFRTIHTIKGTCGFLGLAKLESVAHVGENLLSKLRDGELVLRPDIATGLLSLIDAVREILTNLEMEGSEGETVYTDLIQNLIRLQETELTGPAVGTPNKSSHFIAQDTVKHAEIENDSEPKLPPPTTLTNVPSTKELACETANLAAANSDETRHGGVSESTIRVDVSLLDKLMNRVGELVLARNQILQFSGKIGGSAFLSTTQRLNLITSELQEGVMKTRMQPIGNIWSKFPRVIRDLAVHCGKRVRLEMEGRETELDKTIIEAIKDPLTHLVRNSVDHGIETTEQRLAAGKSAEGCLLLRAFHEGGQVNIEISDDGAGLNLDRIRQKGIERGLVSADVAARMSEREVAQLIFAPGFSTAAKVTNVSGRGVGMDVVKTNIEKIGGTVDIQSQLGYGTTVKLKIPLTLAIIPALIVACGGDRYAIPQVNLLELVRLEGEPALRGIERLHGVPVYRLRGQLLPIVHLQRELGLEAAEGASSSPGAVSGNNVINIVVLRADDRQFGLVVDSIKDTEEIVVKPLSKQLKGIPVYAGSTIMGDGTVALILDVLGIAQKARVVSEVRDRGLSSHGSTSQENKNTRQTLLILLVGGQRLALPISMVSRLETIAREQIERADQCEVVQYRDQILPLVRLGQLLGIPETATISDEPLQVVVYSQGGKSMGLVVDRIADIVETEIEVQRHAKRDGLLSSAVIQNKVTDLLDLPALLRRVDPTFLASPQTV